MGLVMHLGAQIVLNPRRALRSCTRLPTRFREYTCIHGSGHALMRGYHGQLAGAVLACTKLGPRFAPDCAQGAFHDYWISLSGGDGTTRPQEADTDPKSVCGRFAFPRPCWYRYFWERQGYEWVGGVDGLLRLCGDFSGLQRAGCMGGASLLMARERESADHALICSRLNPTDSLDCLRGVNVPAVAANKYEQLRLFRTCAKFPQHARHRCYAWFGKTLDGGHRRPLRPVGVPKAQRAGCPRGLRRRCSARRRGARHLLLAPEAPAGKKRPRSSNSRLRACRGRDPWPWAHRRGSPAPVRVATMSSNSVAAAVEREARRAAELIDSHPAGNACDGERHRSCDAYLCADDRDPRLRGMTTGPCSGSSGAARSSVVNSPTAASNSRQSAQRPRCASSIRSSSCDSSRVEPQGDLRSNRFTDVRYGKPHVP